MAIIIPSYESRENIHTANGGGAAQGRGASGFMSAGQENLGRGMQMLASGADRLANTLYGAEIRKRGEQMELSLLEDMNNFEAEAHAWADAYRQQNQGGNAVNAELDAAAFYRESINTLRQRWKGNERAQLYLERHAGGLAVSGVNAMRDYGNKQQEAWKDSVFAGLARTFKNTVSDWRSTDAEIQAAYQNFAGKNIAYRISKGLDPAAARLETEALYEEAMNANTYNRIYASAQTNPREALHMLDGEDGNDGNDGNDGEEPPSTLARAAARLDPVQKYKLRTAAQARLKDQEQAARENRINAAYSQIDASLAGVELEDRPALVSMQLEQLEKQGLPISDAAQLQKTFDEENKLRAARRDRSEGGLIMDFVSQANEQGLSRRQIEIGFAGYARENKLSQRGREAFKRYLDASAGKAASASPLAGV